VRAAAKTKVYALIVLVAFFSLAALLFMWLYGNIEHDRKRHRVEFVQNDICRECEIDVSTSSD